MERCLWHAQWGDFWCSSLTRGPKSPRSTADANVSLSYSPFPALQLGTNCADASCSCSICPQAKTAISKRMLRSLPEPSWRYQRHKRAAPGRSPSRQGTVALTVVVGLFLSGCCMAQRRSLSGRSPFCQRTQRIKSQCHFQNYHIFVKATTKKHEQSKRKH